MKRQQGSISVFMLVILAAMLLFAVWVTDIMRSYSAHNQLTSAADAALASAILSEQPEQVSRLVTQANMSSGVGKNFRDELELVHQRSDLEESLSVSLTFQPNALVKEPYSISASARAGRNSNKAEIVFMLDVSASMQGVPLEKTRQALLAFADKLYARGNRNRDYLVSVVPASGNVNTGPIKEIYLGAMRPFSHAQVKRENRWQDMFSTGKGSRPAVPGRARKAMCRDLVYEGNNPRTLGLRYFRNLEKSPRLATRNSRRILRPVMPPQVSTFSDGSRLDPAVYPSTNPQGNYREFAADKAIFDDIECHLNPVVPFISERKQLERVARSLISGMNTNNAEGMVWAARLLSPHWQGIWDKRMPDLPRYYGDENNNKYLVVFTDGEHKIDPAFRDKKMQLICTQLKSPHRGVEIFTINFGGQGSSRLLRRCASGPEYYHAANLFNVDKVFELIAEQVINSSLIE